MKNAFRRISAIAVILLAGGAVSGAFGNGIIVPLPAPSFTYSDVWVDASDPVGTSPGPFKTGACDAMSNCETTIFNSSYSNGGGTASLAGVSIWTLQPNGLPPLNPPTSKGELIVSYDFAVVGYYPSGEVPVVVTYSASSDALGAGRGMAYGYIAVSQGAAGTTDQAKFCASTQVGECSSLHAPSSSISGKVSINVVPNVFDPSTAAEVVFAITGEAYQGSYSAQIDPTVSFAPGFDSTGLSLVFSPNPPSSVPEPASWALVLGGLGLLALLRRHIRSVISQG